MRSVPLALAVLTLVTGCARVEPSPTMALGDDAVTIASFNFEESELLAELYAQALEARGIRVVRQMNLGPREIVGPSLERGLVELVPEYAGSLLGFLSRRDPTSSRIADTLARLRTELLGHGLHALEPAPAQDRNTFVVTSALAGRLGLETLSDLAATEDLVLGGPPECPERPLCLLGLQRVYGASFADFVPLDQAGPLTTDALRRGVVDVALLFSTSPQIVRHGFIELEDDRGLQPAENILPVVHGATLERFGPELARALDAVSRLLTTEELRAMNAAIAYGGVTPAHAARDWLLARGLVRPPG